jgi:hypothetical protein
MFLEGQQMILKQWSNHKLLIKIHLNLKTKMCFLPKVNDLEILEPIQMLIIHKVTIIFTNSIFKIESLKLECGLMLKIQSISGWKHK